MFGLATYKVSDIFKNEPLPIFITSVTSYAAFFS